MKEERLNLRIDKKTYNMVSVLKSEFSINVSSMIRNHIQNTYEKEIKNRDRENLRKIKSS